MCFRERAHIASYAHINAIAHNFGLRDERLLIGSRRLMGVASIVLLHASRLVFMFRIITYLLNHLYTYSSVSLRLLAKSRRDSSSILDKATSQGLAGPFPNALAQAFPPIVAIKKIGKRQMGTTTYERRSEMMGEQENL